MDAPTFIGAVLLVASAYGFGVLSTLWAKGYFWDEPDVSYGSLPDNGIRVSTSKYD